MDLNDIIDRIIKLPHSFYNIGNISIHSLLEDTGYFQLYNHVTVERIIERLDLYPEAINDWLNWSANKSVDFGWYFDIKNSGQYIVGFFSDGKRTKVNHYSDEKLACASFINLEIESIKIDA